MDILIKFLKGHNVSKHPDCYKLNIIILFSMFHDRIILEILRHVVSFRAPAEIKIVMFDVRGRKDRERLAPQINQSGDHIVRKC